MTAFKKPRRTVDKRRGRKKPPRLRDTESWDRLVAPVWIFLTLLGLSGSLVAAQQPASTPQRAVTRTLERAGLETPNEISSALGNPAHGSMELVWADGDRGSAVFDRARLRLLSVHRSGQAYYTWPGPEAVAHRGSVNHAPENTLAAVEKAIEFGASRAEIDVRTTADGHLVLLHDSTLDRTTNGTGALAEKNLAEIATLDAGGWWGDEFAGEAVPTLEQALRAMKGRIAPDLDLKDARPEAVVELLSSLGMLPSDDLAERLRPTVFARELEDVQKLLELAPGLMLRPSITAPGGDQELEQLLAEADAPIVNIDWRNFSGELIRSIHLRGKLAFVNTLGKEDSRERIETALAAGADFVQSDLTGALAELTAAARSLPHAGRSLLDAHNAYPYHDKFKDRMQRALAQELPLAIEQDLSWHEDAAGTGRSIVSHGPPFDGREPTLTESFFDQAAPLLEKELASGDPSQWPVMVLNLDLKGQGDHSKHHQALRTALEPYAHLLVSAERTRDLAVQAPLRLAPLLVLTGASDAQQVSFHDQVGVGELLFVFGAAKTNDLGEPEKANNYRRWWNNPWSVVEGKAQPIAGTFDPEERERLRMMIEQAHKAGLWLRFYTLNGHPADQAKSRGFSVGYNFGSLDAVSHRWRAAQELGVDFIASDQYEELATALSELP